MNMSVNFSRLNAYLPAFPSIPQSVSNILASDHVRRIKEIALSVFTTIQNFFNKYSTESPQSTGSVKSIAMFSFISLFALLLISVVRNRSANHGHHHHGHLHNRVGILPPPTPRREQAV